MIRAAALAACMAAVSITVTGALADVPAGRQPGHYQSVPTAQVVCQMVDATCHHVAAYILEHIKPWIGDPALVGAVETQNAANAKLTNREVDKLDIGWIERTDQALIQSKMDNPLSTFLRSKKDADLAVIVEIFAFDQMGLNVGQPRTTTRATRRSTGGPSWPGRARCS